VKRVGIALVALMIFGAAGAFALREFSSESAHKHAAKYYCPMHPSYTSDRPGDCPICNMRLVPMPAAHTPEANANALQAHKQASGNGVSAGEARSDASAHKHAAKYYCPMHPSYTSDRSGDCPICNMRLVPMPAAHTPEAKAKALQAHASGARSIEGHAPVQLTPEQRTMLDIRTEKISRRKMRETTRMVGSIMMERMGMGLAAWVYVPILPSQRNRVFFNQWAEVDVPARGRNLRGVVDFVDSDATLHTHVIKIRLTVSNPETFLKNGMGANVTLEYPERETIAVPAKGVFHSGSREIAFVDLGEGIFEPRALKLGIRSGDFYEVISGLSIRESVAVSGNFLLDSESRIRYALTAPASGAATT